MLMCCQTITDLVVMVVLYADRTGLLLVALSFSGVTIQKIKLFIIIRTDCNIDTAICTRSFVTPGLAEQITRLYLEVSGLSRQRNKQ